MRRAPLSLIVCVTVIALVFCGGCGTSAGDSGGTNEPESPISQICRATGVAKSEAERIISVLSDTGFGGEIEYVTEWNMNGGDSYYRVRGRNGDKREIYIMDGKLVRVTDGQTVYYDEGQPVSTGHIMETGDETLPTPETDAETGAPGSGETVEIVLNTSSKKYHYPGCRAIDSMAEANKKTVYVSDVPELLEMGYSPCGICAKGDPQN